MARPPAPRRHLARRAPARVAALLAAVGLALATAPAALGAPPELRGAATHPLWSNSTVADFDRELDMLRDAGGNAVRIDLSWSSLETNGKGRWSSWYVDKATTFMQHAQARGIKVIATLWSTPCWASTAPEDLKQGCTGAWWDRGVTKYPPANPADYADAAVFAANRWAPYLAGLQLWNEPNEASQHFWRTPDQAGEYVKIVKAAYPAVKAAQPGLTVAAGALSFSDAHFTARLYDLGIKGYFDVYSFHPYSEARPPTYAPTGDARKWSFAAGVPWVREVMLARGDDKPVWFTEFGWTSCNATDAYGLKRCVTLENQASYTRTAWQMMGAWPYVQGATQYNLRNKGTDLADVEHQYGLVYRDFTPKPAYFALRDGLTGAAGEAPPPDSGTGTGGSTDSGSGTGTGGDGSGTPKKGGGKKTRVAMAGTAQVARGRRLRLAVTCMVEAHDRCEGLLTVRLRRRTVAARRLSMAGNTSRVLSIRVRRRYWRAVRRRGRVVVRARGAVPASTDAAYTTYRRVALQRR